MYAWIMEILVKLGKFAQSHEVKVTVSSPDSSVAEVLAEVRRQVSPTIAKNLQLSEMSGSVVFLAMNPDGPERLIETKRLTDYIPTGDSFTLWLMCAHVGDVSERE